MRAAQERLALLGFDPGDIDGIYGPGTRAAVEAFEASGPRLASQAEDGSSVSVQGPLCWCSALHTRFLLKNTA